MTDAETTSIAARGTRVIAIRRILADEPWMWLAAGWRDIWRVPGISLAYGALFTILSAGLTAGLFYIDLLYLLPVLAAGFMLLGPMLAVGLYETSRRLEAGERVRLLDILFVSTRAPTQLAFVGALLVLFFLAWVRVATLLFALFFGTAEPVLAEFLSTLLFSPKGLVFLAVGTVIGAVLAFIAFAVSAISVPMLMVRDTDAITAMAKSVEAVRTNFWPMMVWAWLIALLTACGVATLYLGLVLTFPLVGHATWHAYRALVAEAAR